MNNEQRAASLLNVYTSKAIEEYVVGEHIDLFKIYVVRLSEEDANRIYRDSNGREWTMFWFAKNAGFAETCKKAWNKMKADEKKFIVVNVDMIKDKIQSQEDREWIAKYIRDAA